MVELKRTMQSNAASCIIFGIVFVAAPGTVSEFLHGTSPAPSWLLLGLGIGLIINGVHILWAAQQTPISKAWVFYFSAGDFLWVAGSCYLLVTQLWVNTALGLATVLGVSFMVGAFGMAQLFYSHQR